MTFYKQTEIREYCIESLKDILKYTSLSDFKDRDINDLHDTVFNVSYYIVGRYNASQWMCSNAFDCIDTVKQYEEFNFGEAITDFSDPEKIVNMYVYIVGYEVIQDCFDEVVESAECIEMILADFL